MRYLGLCGRRRAGKDTAIEGLMRMYYPTVRVEWAAEIKRCAARWYGLTPEQMDGALKETIDPRYGKSPRDIMRFLGTEVGRSIYPATWTDFLFAREVPDAVSRWAGGGSGMGAFQNDGIVMISGTRYQNEVDAIRQRGGFVVRISRPGLALDEGDNHASEAGIDALDVDADVTNNGTPADLSAAVSRIIETQFWPRG